MSVSFYDDEKRILLQTSEEDEKWELPRYVESEARPARRLRCLSRDEGALAVITIGLALILLCLTLALSSKAGQIAPLTTSTERSRQRSCNPYDLPGVLRVNTSSAADNVWQPTVPHKDGECEAIDFVSLIRARDPSVEWLRNKTIVIVGDSVDRDHHQHFCDFVQGSRFPIGRDHMLSPPVPEEYEDAPDFLTNKGTGYMSWPHKASLARPFVCHVSDYKLTLINTFTYGLRDESRWLASNHMHYYPPARFEERLDHVTQEVVERVAALFNKPAVPDLISVTTGFWDVLRLWTDGVDGVDQVPVGTNTSEWTQYNLPEELVPWFERRIAEVILHTASMWSNAKRKPFILWRSLHHVKDNKKVPFAQVAALDGLGRGVVQKLLKTESQRRAPWHALKSKASQIVSQSFEDQEDDHEPPRGITTFGDRLKVDNWGSLMLGQEAHFRDSIHHTALPGSYVYANSLLHALKVDLETR